MDGEHKAYCSSACQHAYLGVTGTSNHPRNGMEYDYSTFDPEDDPADQVVGE